MFYRIDFLVREVLKRMDENVAEATFCHPEGAVSVASVVEGMLPEVAGKVIDEAPLSFLDESLELECDMEDHGDGSGHIVLPDDFRRLRSFMMSDWDYPVENAITSSDPRYRMQQSHHPGLRGNPRRPVVATVHRDGFNTLEYYTTGAKEHSVLTARYIPQPFPDREHRIWLPKGLLNNVIEELSRKQF